MAAEHATVAYTLCQPLHQTERIQVYSSRHPSPHSLDVVEDAFEAGQVPQCLQWLPAGVDEAQAAPLDMELNT